MGYNRDNSKKKGVNRMEDDNEEKITHCPQCKEKLIPAFSNEDWGWCDNCCCEITRIKEGGDTNGR